MSGTCVYFARQTCKCNGGICPGDHAVCTPDATQVPSDGWRLWQRGLNLERKAMSACSSMLRMVTEQAAGHHEGIHAGNTYSQSQQVHHQGCMLEPECASTISTRSREMSAQFAETTAACKL